MAVSGGTVPEGVGKVTDDERTVPGGEDGGTVVIEGGAIDVVG